MSALVAANTFLPLRSGTATVRGISRNSSTASRISSRNRNATQRGIHGFWRKTACVGSSGPVKPASAPRPRAAAALLLEAVEVEALARDARRARLGARRARARGPHAAAGRPGRAGPGRAACTSCRASWPLRARGAAAAALGLLLVLVEVLVLVLLEDLLARRRASRRPPRPSWSRTSKRCSTGRPIQICLGGLTVILRRRRLAGGDLDAARSSKSASQQLLGVGDRPARPRPARWPCCAR